MLLTSVHLLSCWALVREGSCSLSLKELWSRLLGLGFDVRMYRMVHGHRPSTASLLGGTGSNTLIRGSGFLNTSPEMVLASRNA